MNTKDTMKSLQEMADDLGAAFDTKSHDQLGAVNRSRKSDYEFEGYLSDLTVQIEYDYSPAEDMTSSYPGSDAEIDLCSVKWNGTELIQAVWGDTSHKRVGERDLPSWEETLIEQCWEHAARSNNEDDGKGDYLYEQRKDREMEERNDKS